MNAGQIGIGGTGLQTDNQSGLGATPNAKAAVATASQESNRRMLVLIAAPCIPDTRRGRKNWANI